MRLVEQAGDPEVDELGLHHVVVGGDDHVGGFEIAMHHASAVNGGQRVGDLPQDWQHEVDIAEVIAELGEALATDQLHDDVGAALVGDIDVQDRKQVGMLKPGQELRLTGKAHHGVKVWLDAQHFGSETAPARDPLNLIHVAHRALSDETHDAVALAKERASGQKRGRFAVVGGTGLARCRVLFGFHSIDDEARALFDLVPQLDVELRNLVVTIVELTDLQPDAVSHAVDRLGQRACLQEGNRGLEITRRHPRHGV